MDAVDELVADIWATGLSPDTHPVQFARDHLKKLGALPVAALADMPDKTRVLGCRCIAGSVDMAVSGRTRGQIAWASSVNAAATREVGGDVNAKFVVSRRRFCMRACP
jgi:hypothetical protein